MFAEGLSQVISSSLALQRRAQGAEAASRAEAVWLLSIQGAFGVYQYIVVLVSEK